MRTVSRALYIIRHEGIYYTTYRFRKYVDEYSIVNDKEIPNAVEQGRAEYEDWLHHMRSRYSSLNRILVDKVLPIVIVDDEDHRDHGSYKITTTTTGGCIKTIDIESRRRRHLQSDVKSWHFHLDPRLRCLPSVFGPPLDPVRDVPVTYMADLDRELFIVKRRRNNTEAEFPLDNVPRTDSEWAPGFRLLPDHDCDGFSKGSFAMTHAKNANAIADAGCSSSSSGPEHSPSPLKPSHDVRSAPKYNNLQLRLVVPKTSISLDSRMAPAHLLRLGVYSIFHPAYREELQLTMRACQRNDLAFKEFAFAIVSLASGSFIMREIDKSYIFRGPEDLAAEHSVQQIAGRNVITPSFGTGRHQVGKDPGAAPSAEIYWFNGAVVCLEHCILKMPSTQFEEAVFRTVEFGRLWSGGRRSTFHGVILSLHDVILVRCCGDIVEHTALIPLGWETSKLETSQVFSSSSSSSLSHSTGDNSNSNTGMQSKLHSRGFMAMMHLFDAAATEALIPYVSARLPLEICEMILGHVDDVTSLACLQVSLPFRAYLQKHPRVNNYNLRRKDCTAYITSPVDEPDPGYPGDQSRFLPIINAAPRSTDAQTQTPLRLSRCLTKFPLEYEGPVDTLRNRFQRHSPLLDRRQIPSHAPLHPSSYPSFRDLLACHNLGIFTAFETKDLWTMFLTSQLADRRHARHQNKACNRGWHVHSPVEADHGHYSMPPRIAHIQLMTDRWRPRYWGPDGDVGSPSVYLETFWRILVGKVSDESEGNWLELIQDARRYFMAYYTQRPRKHVVLVLGFGLRIRLFWWKGTPGAEGSGFERDEQARMGVKKVRQTPLSGSYGRRKRDFYLSPSSYAGSCTEKPESSVRGDEVGSTDKTTTTTTNGKFESPEFLDEVEKSSVGPGGRKCKCNPSPIFPLLGGKVLDIVDEVDAEIFWAVFGGFTKESWGFLEKLREANETVSVLGPEFESSRKAGFKATEAAQERIAGLAGRGKQQVREYKEQDEDRWRCLRSRGN